MSVLKKINKNNNYKWEAQNLSTQKVKTIEESNKKIVVDFLSKDF